MIDAQLQFARRITASDTAPAGEERFASAPPEQATEPRVRIIRPEELPTEYIRQLEDMLTEQHRKAPLPFTIPGTRIEL